MFHLLTTLRKNCTTTMTTNRAIARAPQQHHLLVPKHVSTAIEEHLKNGFVTARWFSFDPEATVLHLTYTEKSTIHFILNQRDSDPTTYLIYTCDLSPSHHLETPNTFQYYPFRQFHASFVYCPRRSNQLSSSPSFFHCPPNSRELLSAEKYAALP